MQLAFMEADLLLPVSSIDPAAFSVIACDQFTSQPEYWQEAARIAGDTPSALQLICPEIYLKDQNLPARIDAIWAHMENYLKEGVFQEYPHSFFYVRRTLPNGKLRQGVVGMVDLEAYDFSQGSHSPIRASEKTIVDRIPPRARIRRDAPLELSHILLLADDPKCQLIEPLKDLVQTDAPVYDFDLMLGSGHLTGYRLKDAQAAQFQKALEDYAAKAAARCPEAPLLFAVGDGNHSLATAKAHWEALKPTLSAAEQQTHPARFAMVELLNLYDETLEFEAIHRVLFDVDTDDLWDALCKALSPVPGRLPGMQHFSTVQNGVCTDWSIPNPPHSRAVGTLQPFWEAYLEAHPDASIDYIHGEDAVFALCSEDNRMGFLLPAIQKEELFPSILKNGSLPLKSFSIGEAKDKRFYLEARKIR